MKTKAKSGESESNVKLIAEIAKLKVENARLRTDGEILNGKASPLTRTAAPSIWASLKRELLEKGRFDSVEDAKIELFEYIEVYYNRIRKHSALDYMSPEKFEQIYKQNELVTLQSKLSV